jgi:hypothetical protein
MEWPKNAMDVFKLLDKSNCKECGAPTCLAFAAAVYKGEQPLGACPHLDPEIVTQYAGSAAPPNRSQADTDARLAELRAAIAKLDLQEAARRSGGDYANGKLTLKVMGKDFSVDANGKLYTDIHIHSWISAPFFEYLLNCQGAVQSGRWLPLRELASGKDWGNFFTHRVEKPMKKVADTYTDLFEDMVHLFNGKPVEHHYQSDISLVLHPLPKLPMLICYWKPEDGMASDLNIFFDANAEMNLPIESIYTLGVGLVVMFEKIALRHGVAVDQ